MDVMQRLMREYGGPIMREHNGEPGRGPTDTKRRVWLRHALTGMAVMAGWRSAASSFPVPEAPDALKQEEKAELDDATAKLNTAGIGPLRTVRSVHYQAIGDASERFMKLILEDSELLALDYIAHFKSHGFEVEMPKRRLTLILFIDDRPFSVFLHVPTVIGAVNNKQGLLLGLYKRDTNAFHLFDWRNVPTRLPDFPQASHAITETLGHEGMHQLTFNTRLLNRKGDVPKCISEGLGMYGEARKLHGRNEPGRINLKRLEDLTKIQREKPWIPLRELFADDRVWGGPSGRRVMLAYAQSWLLIYFLMKEPNRLPQFRAYLKTIFNRTGSDHRLDDAITHFGNLEDLDRELRVYSVRLLRSA
jgi:hypothetical protein